MTRCEAFNDTHEPDCENEATHIYYQWKLQSGYPISLCKPHLDEIIEHECYDEIKEKEQ